MELVSIIVPVYNVEKYLRECLDSILASTYQYFEVILVDDGSPDSSGVICDEYAQKDERIRVIHQENKGLVGARNTGLDYAHGTYVAFVDSDDVVSPILYEKLVEAMESEDADMAACESRNTYETLDISKDSISGTLYTMEDFDQQLAVLTCAPSIRQITWSSCYVWNKLYRRAKIQTQFREECVMCEDLRFNWDYIQNSKKMVIVPAGMYLYRQNAQSITGAYRSNRSDPKMIGNSIANATLWAFVAKNAHQADSTLKCYLEARTAYTAHGALWRIYSIGKQKENTAYALEAKRLIKDHFCKLFRDKETYDIKLRCIIGVCRYCFPLWRFGARIFGVLLK